MTITPAKHNPRYAGHNTAAQDQVIAPLIFKEIFNIIIQKIHLQLIVIYIILTSQVIYLHSLSFVTL